MPIHSAVSLSEALVVTTFTAPMAAASFIMSLYWRPLRMLPTTRWAAPVVCVIASVMTIAAWILYAIS